uniref:Uncharacterized protein n=1 Tax=Acrobeloides nanus TaxID=290746 RepID=A0A914CGI0_9BILA
MRPKNPNAELIAAIKDVVKKFKASLDRSGVHDDIRQMGQQIETTWNDMRRGRLDEWIERANRVLADAMIEKEVTMEPVPAQENDEKTISKKSSLVEKVAKKLEPAYSETISFFSVKPRKGKALAGDKKNTAL